MSQVSVQLIEAYSQIEASQPAMRHRRRFSDTTPDQVLSLLMGLKFYGKGGLMEDSVADSEECSQDRNSRFIRTFKPLGDSLVSLVAGSFHVRQELLDCFPGPNGIVATIQMTFSPSKASATMPTGNFLWMIEPDPAINSAVLWTESINVPESRTKQIPNLRIAFGSRRVFLIGHNNLNNKAAQRIADVLNRKDKSGPVFASYAESDRLNFRPSRCKT